MPKIDEVLKDLPSEAEVIDITDNKNHSTRRSRYENGFSSFGSELRQNPIFCQIEQGLQQRFPEVTNRVTNVVSDVIEQWQGEGEFDKLDIPSEPVKKVVVEVLNKAHKHPMTRFLRK